MVIADYRSHFILILVVWRVVGHNEVDVRLVGNGLYQGDQSVHSANTAALAIARVLTAGQYMMDTLLPIY